MRDLPSGTVTFLFTDIEGSTRLLHDYGDRYADLLAEHRRVVRSAFTNHDGVEVDTQGDAFFVAFGRADDALAAASEIQAAEGPVRVRIGIHTGTPTVTDEGYVGIDVHRAARICAAAHGGQVVLSEEARRALGSDPGLDLGRHRLKDLGAPERLFQLGERPFPPLRSLNATNLPAQAGALVGRAGELREVAGLIDGARVVTLTGAGGSGKTRLALQVAAESVQAIGDRQRIAYALTLLAWAAAIQGQPALAGRLWGAVESESARAAIGQWELGRETYRSHVLVAAGPDFDRGLDEGVSLTLDEAVEIALAS